MDIKKSQYSGLFTGLIQSVVFNPVDKALYLHVINHTKLFNRANWIHPYQGISNSLINRCISYGYYYTFIDIFNKFSEENVSNKKIRPFVTGALTGITTAVLINPLNTVKYYSWNDQNRKLSRVAWNMYKEQGVRSFYRGLLSTIKRDVSFTTTYTITHPIIKNYFGETNYLSFLIEIGVVTCGTIISAPFNYVRNQKYKVDPHLPSPTMIKVFGNLYK